MPLIYMVKTKLTEQRQKELSLATPPKIPHFTPSLKRILPINAAKPTPFGVGFAVQVQYTQVNFGNLV